WPTTNGWGAAPGPLPGGGGTLGCSLMPAPRKHAGRAWSGCDRPGRHCPERDGAEGEWSNDSGAAGSVRGRLAGLDHRIRAAALEGGVSDGEAAVACLGDPAFVIKRADEVALF